jgi:phenylacetate-CoA ligase
VSLHENQFRHILYPFHESVLRRRATLKRLAEYERSQWLSADETEALQWSKLKRLPLTASGKRRVTISRLP